MLRRTFLKGLGSLAALVGVPWGLAHHRPGHDGGPPGTPDPEPTPTPTPTPDPGPGLLVVAFVRLTVPFVPAEPTDAPWPGDWGRTLVVAHAHAALKEAA